MRQIIDLFDTERETAERRTTSLAGLAVALLLIVASLFVIRQLQARTVLEDCVLSGRPDCQPVQMAGG